MTHLSWMSTQSWLSLKLAMGTSWTGLFLCIFVGDFIAAQYLPNYRDDALPPGFFESFKPHAFDRRSDFMPYNSFFGSRETPSLNMFADLPAMMSVPRVEVFCDDDKLTLVVDKRSFRHSLNRGDLQLGEGCYSNAELSNKFVFSYGLDQCGTKHVIQDGLRLFTNSLHLNFKKPFVNWWPTPPAIHISCIPTRSYDYSGITRTPPEPSEHITIKTMTPSWSDTESNVYRRGQVVNLQVSGKIRLDQQLFIQSCFVSASSEPQARPRHAVVLNKGCATSVGSPHPIVQFVASNGADEVNFILNTSHLISKLYIHCSVLVSDQGVTCGSKSCNYNAIKSRWEDLSGDIEVCDCCSSKCKGSPAKNFPDAKVTISTGPLVIVDAEITQSHPASEPEERLGEAAPNPTQAGLPHLAEDIVSGTSMSPRQGVVMVRQDPGARQTLWLPGQVHGTENVDGSPSEEKPAVQQSDGVWRDVPAERPPTAQRMSPLNLLKRQIKRKGGASKQAVNLPLMVNGWAIPPQPDIAFIVEEFETNEGFRQAGEVDPKLMQDDNFLPAEVSVNYLLVTEEPPPSEVDHVAAEEEPRRRKRFSDESDGKDFNRDEGVEPGCAKNVEPIIRTKIEFTKAVDGSKKLSYEEDVIRQQGGRSEVSRFGKKVAKREPKLKGLQSTFLYLLRRMDNAE